MPRYRAKDPNAKVQFVYAQQWRAYNENSMGDFARDAGATIDVNPSTRLLTIKGLGADKCVAVNEFVVREPGANRFTIMGNDDFRDEYAIVRD